jgi:regulator of sigma E protease
MSIKSKGMMLVMNALVWLFAFLVFNLIILAHEYGHYSTARKFGVKVSEFALGMGPVVAKVERGGTTYSIRCFPIGGFCEMEGEENGSRTKHSFGSARVWQRMIIMVAGAFMNILAGIIFSLIIALCRSNIPTTFISSFDRQAASYASGLRAEDEIISVNGYKTHIERDVYFAISITSGENIDMEIMRGGKHMIIKNVKFAQTENEGKTALQIDFHLAQASKNFVNVINYSVLNVVSFSRISWKSITELVRGKLSLKDLAGPIGVASQIKTITDHGLEIGFAEAILSILSFMSMFTVSIGIFNLLPFPALDGGRVLMLIPEAITGKPLNPKFESFVNVAGFCLLILLMILVAFNDVVRLIKGYFNK